MEDLRLPTWIHVDLGDGGMAGSPPSSSLVRTSSSRVPPQSCVDKQTTGIPESMVGELNVVPLLLQLARERNWELVAERGRTHPSEATPIATKISCSPSRSRAQRERNAITGSTIYVETALSVFCSSDLSFLDPGSVLQTAKSLLDASPEQVRCSQLCGHTPLRAALNNPSCPPSLIWLLLEADVSIDDLRVPPPAREQVDRDGLEPMDIIVKHIQLGTHAGAFDYLEAFLSLDTMHVTSPLVKLYSLGTSFGLLPASRAITRSTVTDAHRLDRIMSCTQLVLNRRPASVYQCSPLTGCSPLHVALRNYGNFVPLIRHLLEADHDGTTMKRRNNYGDLPLHVACAVGVPLEMLRLILARTLLSTESTESGPHPLVWSKNFAGYTPIDLEWIRHIEAGNGFYSHRSFYPLDARGIRKPAGRDGELYDLLLRQAVDKVLESNPGTVDLAAEENRAFGLLLHRIFLVIRASFHDSFSRSPVDLSGNILHLASALSGPVGPVLPRPILDMIRWQYPEELHRDDHVGRLPLHYCFPSIVRALDGEQTTDDAVETKTALHWREWVHHLMQSDISSCRKVDNRGRLPVHGALECPGSLSSQVQGSLAATVDDLFDSFPESVEICDPVTGMYPFMIAAANQNLPLDTVYRLLKRCPDVLAQFVRHHSQPGEESHSAMEIL